MEQNKVEILEALNNEKMYSLRGDEVRGMCSPEGDDTYRDYRIAYPQKPLRYIGMQGEGMKITTIDREDMLSLTRRMTEKRTSITRMAGAYLDAQGDVEGTFNIHFQKLSSGERKENLALAKKIPFSETNRNLKRYRFLDDQQKHRELPQLLERIRSCGLKNDALMDIFYEEAAFRYPGKNPYAILFFHDRYDIPRKGSDGVRQWESEEVFEYLICAFCPLKGEYQAADPEFGFLYPAFSHGSGDPDRIDVYQREPEAHTWDTMLEFLGVYAAEKKEKD